MYEINDYLEDKFVNLVDHELFRPNGIAVSPDGSMLYVSESCQGNFEATCSQGKVRFNQYSIDLENRSTLPQKIGSFMFDVEGVGASDGFKIHYPTGLIVSSCPSGLCIVKPMKIETPSSNEVDTGGELLAHIRLGDQPTKVSNLAFGGKYMYITAHERIMRILLANSNSKQTHLNDEL